MILSGKHSKIQAVAFDMDGLMFNSEDVYFETGTRLMREYGAEYTQELSLSLMGCAPRETFQKMIEWNLLNVGWEELQQKSNRIFLSIVRDTLRPMKGLMTLLDFLDENHIPKAVCTSSCREIVGEMLPIFDLERRFDFIITSDELTHGKPHPEIYLLAASRFGVRPESMMILEDSHNGCLAGANAGGFVVAVPGDHSRTQDFSMASCRAESLDDPQIFQILKNS